MVQIKFDAARIQELKNRLDDINNQLKTSNEANNTAIASIENNINGSNVNSTLSQYRQTCESVTRQAYATLADVAGALGTKVASYTQTEQEAADVLTDVQSILQGLE